MKTKAGEAPRDWAREGRPRSVAASAPTPAKPSTGSGQRHGAAPISTYASGRITGHGTDVPSPATRQQARTTPALRPAAIPDTQYSWHQHQYRSRPSMHDEAFTGMSAPRLAADWRSNRARRTGLAGRPARYAGTMTTSPDFAAVISGTFRAGSSSWRGARTPLLLGRHLYAVAGPDAGLPFSGGFVAAGVHSGRAATQASRPVDAARAGYA